MNFKFENLKLGLGNVGVRISWISVRTCPILMDSTQSQNVHTFSFFFLLMYTYILYCITINDSFTLIDNEARYSKATFQNLNYAS